MQWWGSTRYANFGGCPCKPWSWWRPSSLFVVWSSLYPSLCPPENIGLMEKIPHYFGCTICFYWYKLLFRTPMSGAGFWQSTVLKVFMVDGFPPPACRWWGGSEKSCSTGAIWWGYAGDSETTKLPRDWEDIQSPTSGPKGLQVLTETY